MKHIGRATASAVVALILTLGLAATAVAAPPSATTNAARNVTADGATLRALVNPNGQPTTVHFEYGRTRAYGSRTADVQIGGGDAARRVRVRVTGLRPFSRYHFRVVASNPSGVTSGDNRSFRTQRVPLGLHVVAPTNPVTFGRPTFITGALSGTGNANRQVVLQQRAFPFTAEFVDAGNPQVTDDNGGFAFPLLPLPGTTQFQVRTEPPGVTSPVLTLGVAARVGTRRSARRVKRYGRVRLSGRVRPARVGARFSIQKKTLRGDWVTVRRGLTRRGTSEYSRYTKRFRVPRAARYRVVVHLAGSIVTGIGREVVVRVRR